VREEQRLRYRELGARNGARLKRMQQQHPVNREDTFTERRAQGEKESKRKRQGEKEERGEGEGEEMKSYTRTKHRQEVRLVVVHLCQEDGCDC